MDTRGQQVSPGTLPECTSQSVRLGSLEPCVGALEPQYYSVRALRYVSKAAECQMSVQDRSVVLRGLSPSVTALARPSRNGAGKLQARPLVREGSPLTQNRKCRTLITIWPWTPGGCPPPTLSDGLTPVAEWLQLQLRKSLIQCVLASGHQPWPVVAAACSMHLLTLLPIPPTYDTTFALCSSVLPSPTVFVRVVLPQLHARMKKYDYPLSNWH
jgi:hypothetical protein